MAADADESGSSGVTYAESSDAESSDTESSDTVSSDTESSDTVSETMSADSGSEFAVSEGNSVFVSELTSFSARIPEESPKSRFSARTVEAGCRHMSAASTQESSFFFIVLILLGVILGAQGICAMLCLRRFRVSSLV